MALSSTIPLSIPFAATHECVPANLMNRVDSRPSPDRVSHALHSFQFTHKTNSAFDAVFCKQRCSHCVPHPSCRPKPDTLEAATQGKHALLVQKPSWYPFGEPANTRSHTHPPARMPDTMHAPCHRWRLLARLTSGPSLRTSSANGNQ